MRDGGLQRPHAGPLLAGLIENHIDQRFASLGINLAKNLGRDVDQVAVQFAFVPFSENFGEFGRFHAEHVFHNGVGFADELHVTVFDSVVHHFDVVTGAVRAHVTATRFAIHLSGDFAENRRDDFPRLARPARHQ